MGRSITAGRGAYVGLFLLSMATLTFELLLTRIFSVTLWNNYAFVAVSLAMFGLTAGAVFVHVLPNIFRPERTWAHASASSLLTGIWAIASLEFHRSIRVPPDLSLAALPLLGATYLISSIPFFFSSIAISLVLTRFPPQISRLYAADLCGAALGCILLSFVLQASDGPTAVYVTAAIAGAAAIAFALDGKLKSLTRISSIATVAASAFVLLNIFLIQSGKESLVRLDWAKDSDEVRPLYERWNSYSRVRVWDKSHGSQLPVGWGFSSKIPDQWRGSSLALDIDASAATTLTKFDGDLNQLGYLAWDITNLAHQVKSGSDVLIIGSGGGRDILSSLYFHEKSVTGVEMNQAVYQAATGTFGNYTGHLDQRSNVRIVNDEARSYLARTPEKYDLIQLSLVDTWAATAAGAFVLSENALYTTEAWNIYLSRLRPGGMISVSRWYSHDKPYEVPRLAALAAQSLREHGATRPQDHIVIAFNIEPAQSKTAGVATLLASIDPFTPEELSRLNAAAAQRGFHILFSPLECHDDLLRTVITADNIALATDDLPVNLVPPTDNKPFFFDNSRPAKLFGGGFSPGAHMQGALTILLGLLGVVIVFSAIFILTPLGIHSARADNRAPKPRLRPTCYFALIGVAFMTVEIAQMQRLLVLVGHPAYSLTVVLFSLLISSGIGSFSTARINDENLFRLARLRMLGLIATLIILGVLSPILIESFQSAATPMRLGIALALLLPAGFFMGMAFPIGMKWASANDADHTAWLWGVNGAASVCASVLAVIISMASGIDMAWWFGVAIYIIAAVLLTTARRTVVEVPEPKSKFRFATREKILSGAPALSR
jgi:hypothetical protein